MVREYLYENDPQTGEPIMRKMTEEELRKVEEEWRQILTHEPVFSSGNERRRYIIRFDEVTEAFLADNEIEYEFEIESKNCETAIYDFLRKMEESYWAILEEDSHIWALPADEDSEEKGKMYEFKPDSSVLSGKLQLNGTDLECWHSECPNDEYPHMMHVIYADRRSEDPVCFICDLMPVCIAKETISKALGVA